MQAAGSGPSLTSTLEARISIPRVLVLMKFGFPWTRASFLLRSVSQKVRAPSEAFAVAALFVELCCSSLVFPRANLSSFSPSRRVCFYSKLTAVLNIPGMEFLVGLLCLGQNGLAGVKGVGMGTRSASLPEPWSSGLCPTKPCSAGDGAGPMQSWCFLHRGARCARRKNISPPAL